MVWSLHRGRAKSGNSFYLEIKSVSAVKLITIMCTRLHKMPLVSFTFCLLYGFRSLHLGLARKGLSPPLEHMREHSCMHALSTEQGVLGQGQLPLIKGFPYTPQNDFSPAVLLG